MPRSRKHTARALHVVVSGTALLASLLSCGEGGNGEPIDITPPSMPAGLEATPLSSSSIRLEWNASTDNTGIDGYRVYRGGALRQNTQELQITDTGLSASTSYCYQVSAVDRAGNESGRSAERCATTAASGGSSFTLTVNKGGSGSGTVTGTGINCGSDCTETVAPGTMVTLAASPASGSSLASWVGCDSTSGTGCTVTMNAPRTVTVSFTATAVTYTLTVNKGGSGSGTVTGTGINCGSDCTETVASGTMVTLAASPASGSSFSNWVGCDSTSGTGCTVTMNAPRTVTATFIQTICTPGQTRCVAGNIDVQEICNTSGAAWNPAVSCPDHSACSSNACRTICDITATPLYPWVCLSPINDAKNNGEWRTWASSTMASPTYTDGRSFTSTGGYAPIYSSGLTWPYAWSIGSSSMVEIQFKLSQFTGYRHPRLAFKAKRAGVVNDGTNNYSVGVFSGSTLVGSCIWGPVSYGWQAASCYVSTPYNQQLNYSGGWNMLALGITGNGYGNAIDLLDVNYILLTIEP